MNRLLVSFLTICFVAVELALAQSNIRVWRKPLSGGPAVDVTANTAIVTLDNPNASVAITADAEASDYFIRQQNVAEAINAITFTANPDTPATVYRVSIGASFANLWDATFSWVDSEFVPQAASGCSSLGSFTGFGQAGATDKDPSYYVKVRIGVSDTMGHLECNEVVRVDGGWHRD